MNIEDYEVVRPRSTPAPLAELREASIPDTIYARTVDGDEFLFNQTTLVDKPVDNPARLRKRPAQMPVSTFDLITGSPDLPRDQWEVVETFGDLNEAKARLAEVKGTGTFAMRKNTVLAPQTDPLEWGRARIESGEWQLPNFGDLQLIPDHCAHLSQEKEGMIAYWATPEDAYNERLTVQNVGRYLTAHYDLEPKDVERLIAIADPPGELEFTTDFVSGYKIGTYSCMKGKSCVEVYNAGDLQLALLKNTHGEYTARCLVWPERKVSGRIYGDWARMRSALIINGYELDVEAHGAAATGVGGFEGARIKKIRSGNGWLMPWIDLGYKVYDDGEFFRLSMKHGVCVNNTSNTYSGRIPPLDLEQAA